MDLSLTVPLDDWSETFEDLSSCFNMTSARVTSNEVVDILTVLLFILIILSLRSDNLIVDLMLTAMISPNATNLTISKIETNWIPVVSVFQVQRNAYMFWYQQINNAKSFAFSHLPA